jgi:hypothetical protein
MTTRLPELLDVIPMQGVEETDVQWITPIATLTPMTPTTAESQVCISHRNGLVFLTDRTQINSKNARFPPSPSRIIKKRVLMPIPISISKWR